VGMERVARLFNPSSTNSLNQLARKRMASKALLLGALAVLLVFCDMAEGMTRGKVLAVDTKTPKDGTQAEEKSKLGTFEELTGYHCDADGKTKKGPSTKTYYRKVYYDPTEL